MIPRPAVLILAGGRASRMGGEKALRRFAGATLLDRVIGRMAGQGSLLLLNANGDPARFAAAGLPIVADTLADHLGPLAGVLAGLEWLAMHRPEITELVTVPVDSPFVPRDLVDRLLAARKAGGDGIACATSQGRIHPVVGLWPVRSASGLRDALLDGLRRVQDWTARSETALADFATDPVDPFLNVNEPGELKAAEKLAAAYPYV